MKWKRRFLSSSRRSPPWKCRTWSRGSRPRRSGVTRTLISRRRRSFGRKPRSNRLIATAPLTGSRSPLTPPFSGAGPTRRRGTCCGRRRNGRKVVPRETTNCPQPLENHWWKKSETGEKCPPKTWVLNVSTLTNTRTRV